MEAFRSKKQFKRLAGKCQICGEKEYSLLDVHRWRIEGKEGGKYSTDNCVCICCKCHRLIHDNKIKILGIYDSSMGKVINYIDEHGQEQFNKI
jgi:5-methylcytosine-specific restriction endonuclease McrA